VAGKPSIAVPGIMYSLLSNGAKSPAGAFTNGEVALAPSKSASVVSFPVLLAKPLWLVSIFDSYHHWGISCILFKKGCPCVIIDGILFI